MRETKKISKCLDSKNIFYGTLPGILLHSETPLAAQDPLLLLVHLGGQVGAQQLISPSYGLQVEEQNPYLASSTHWAQKYLYHRH